MSIIREPLTNFSSHLAMVVGIMTFLKSKTKTLNLPFSGSEHKMSRLTALLIRE